MTDAPEHANRGPGGRFAPGNAVNPHGRPRGLRQAVFTALDAIGDAASQAVLNKVIEGALAGDMRAAEALLARTWPARKGRPILLPLPEVTTAADIPIAMAAIVTAVANGTISPEEAAAVAAVLEAQRRAIETADLARRIDALEAGNIDAEVEGDE